MISSTPKIGVFGTHSGVRLTRINNFGVAYCFRVFHVGWREVRSYTIIPSLQVIYYLVVSRSWNFWVSRISRQVGVETTPSETLHSLVNTWGENCFWLKDCFANMCWTNKKIKKLVFFLKKIHPSYIPLGLVLFVLNVAYFGFQLGLLKAPLKYHYTLLLIVCGSKKKIVRLRLVLLLSLHTLNLRMLLAWMCPQILAVKDPLNTRIEFAISIILILGFDKLPFTTQSFDNWSIVKLSIVGASSSSQVWGPMRRFLSSSSQSF